MQISGVDERRLARGRAACNAAAVFLIIGLAIGPGALPGLAKPTRERIEKIVAGLNGNDKVIGQIRILAQDPVESASLLIAQLHPVKGVRILSWKQRKWKNTMHVVWCLRALRYLTKGVDFRAKTAYHFRSGPVETRRKWFVGGDGYLKDGTVSFFGTWMSRDSTYIAPRDAQIKIIRRWKAWYRRHGKTFHYVNPKKYESPDIWYF